MSTETVDGRDVPTKLEMELAAKLFEKMYNKNDATPLCVVAMECIADAQTFYRGGLSMLITSNRVRRNEAATGHGGYETNSQYQFMIHDALERGG